MAKMREHLGPSAHWQDMCYVCRGFLETDDCLEEGAWRRISEQREQARAKWLAKRARIANGEASPCTTSHVGPFAVGGDFESRLCLGCGQGENCGSRTVEEMCKEERLAAEAA